MATASPLPRQLARYAALAEGSTIFGNTTMARPTRLRTNAVGLAGLARVAGAPTVTSVAAGYKRDVNSYRCGIRVWLRCHPDIEIELVHFTLLSLVEWSSRSSLWSDLTRVVPYYCWTYVSGNCERILQNIKATIKLATANAIPNSPIMNSVIPVPTVRGSKRPCM